MTASTSGATSAAVHVSDLLKTALHLRGTSYLFGGTDPQSGFDCSGFVRFVYGQHSVALPRTVAEQYVVGAQVDDGDVVAGDLIFFSTTAPGPTHVGIAIDEHTFVHAPGTGAVVRVERFDTPYWGPKRIGNRRVARGE